MASTLQGGRPKDRITGKGHGTEALGPGDTSDSGADITGGPGLAEGEVLGLDRGTNEDADRRRASADAGRDIGDRNLDSDSDSTGAGERRAAGRDPGAAADADVRPDRIVQAGIDASEPGGSTR